MHIVIQELFRVCFIVSLYFFFFGFVVPFFIFCLCGRWLWAYKCHKHMFSSSIIFPPPKPPPLPQKKKKKKRKELGTMYVCTQRVISELHDIACKWGISGSTSVDSFDPQRITTRVNRLQPG